MIPIQNNTLFGGTVPPNNTLFGGTVPPNSTLFGGTPDLEKWHIPQWKALDFKDAGMQSEYANMQVFKYTSMQVWKCESMLLWKNIYMEGWKLIRCSAK